MNKYGFIFVCFLLAFNSCNKAVIKYNTDFIGYWKTEVKTDLESNIEKQSYLILGEAHNEYGLNCQINCFGCNCSVLAEGRAIVNSSRGKIRIGSSGNTHTLTINKEPYLNIDSVWVCELNNELYYKQ